MLRRRRPALLVALVGVFALVAIVPFTIAEAAKPEDAPPESRDQVALALTALRDMTSGVRRSGDAGAPGTIEEAMARFAPGKFHPVDEGTVLPLKKDGRCPSEMSLVAGRVCVDRYEASLVEGADGGELAVSPYHPPAAGHVYVARSRPGVVPQAYISGPQAAAACKAAGKRLCAPVEWRAACGGREGLAFPYGKKREPGKCHDHGTAPMLVFFADTMKRGWGPLELNDPRLNQEPGTVDKTGASPACVNDYGLYDMVGNLHEWTSDPNGTFQGGYWLDTSEHGEGCAYRTIGHGFDYHDYSIGFRCCKDPVAEP